MTMALLHRFVLLHMITVSPFRNEDFCVVHEIWTRCLPASGGRLRLFAPPLMEEMLFGSLLFDYEGLQIAWETDTSRKKGVRPVGLVHAASVPNRKEIEQEAVVGVLCMLLIVPDCSEPEATRMRLLEAGERYLFNRGIRTVYGGSIHEGVPFYCGYYGAGEPIGIFASDKETYELFGRNGYSIKSRTTRLELPIQNYQPKLTMKSLFWNDKVKVFFEDRAKPRHWWDAQLKSRHTWIEAKAVLKNDTTRSIATTLVCIPYHDVEQVRGQPDIFHQGNIAELIDMNVRPDFRGKGVLTHLHGKLLQEIGRRQGIVRLETQISDEFPTLVPFLRKMGWVETDLGAIFVKKDNGAPMPVTI